MTKQNDNDADDNMPLIWWGILIVVGIAYAVWSQGARARVRIDVAEALGTLTGLLGIPFIITLVIHRFDWRRADERGFLITFTVIYLIVLVLNVFSTLQR